MNNVSYSRINAFYYQLTEFVERLKPGFINQAWVKKIGDNCRPDWAEWRTHLVMINLEDQFEDLHALWAIEEFERNLPIYSEKAPDGSEAQELLGGEMGLTAPWNSDKS